jgi:hypothetical protein
LSCVIQKFFSNIAALFCGTLHGSDAILYCCIGDRTGCMRSWRADSLMRSAVLSNTVWDMVPPSRVESQCRVCLVVRDAIIAASHPPSVFHSAAFSLPPSWEQAAAAVGVQTAFQQEECAQAANARSAAESSAAEQAHCGWALSDCSAVLMELDSVPAVVPAGPWGDGWVPAYSAQADLVVLLELGSAPAVVLAGLLTDGWVPAYLAQADLVVLLELDSVPADYSKRADPREQHCSLDGQTVHSPVAELRRVSPERCKVSLLVLHAQRRGH